MVIAFAVSMLVRAGHFNASDGEMRFFRKDVCVYCM